MVPRFDDKPAQSKQAQVDAYEEVMNHDPVEDECDRILEELDG